MQIEPTALPDVLILIPRRFQDPRGWFSETWNSATLAAAGLERNWVQDNHSASVVKGTVRGLHYQTPPRAQDKLVRCTRGAILDVAVDIRTGSASYGKWTAVELTEDNARQLFIPKGFLHGFVTLTDRAEVQYKCTDYYSPEHEGVVRWDDPEIGIDWGVSRPILSDKDASAPPLSGIGAPFPRGWE